MAHKKGGGSTKNGRDSNAQRLGVKRFGGQSVLPAASSFASGERNSIQVSMLASEAMIPSSLWPTVLSSLNDLAKPGSA